MFVLPGHTLNFLCVVAILLAASIGNAQPIPSSVSDSTESRQAVAVAASVIPPNYAATDITRLAGEYSYGNGLDLNCSLEISSDGRFLYKKCSYEVLLEQAKGKVSLEDGRLILTPEKSHETWPRGTSPILIPISWGQRLYLIPQNDIAGFSNQINRGIEPVSRGSMGSYYLREGDWDRPASGQPDLPEEWKKRLLDEPVTGLVAGRDPLNRWIISLGKNYGVYDGMELSAWAPGLLQFVTLLVTDTGKDTSAVAVVDAPPEISIMGWTVYSKITPPQTEK